MDAPKLLGTDEQDGSQEPDPASALQKFLNERNIADKLDEDKLKQIGDQVVRGYEADLQSRDGWEKDLEMWVKLALQVRENKTFPWPNASNVKYPLLSTAAMQFSARAYPALVPPDGDVVKIKVIGYDPDGKKAERAERVSKHMSYQIMERMPDWENDMDKLLIILPIVGTCFKKTYWDSGAKVICSKLVMPKDLVVNYWATSLEAAERKTERLFMSKRLIKERMNAKLWLDLELSNPGIVENKIDKDKLGQMEPAMADETTPFLILEQHTYLDLDDDSYPEPYVVTVDHASKKVLRITPRYRADGVETDDSGKVIKITATEFYTKYGFIPNPDGGFYDLGFGLLLGTLNEAVNTLTNQIIDAGTWRNLQAGFISKGLRIKMGELRLQPGQWVAVNSTAEDLHKQIVPIPSNEPSNVLFELLGTLITSAKELASVAEIFVGKMPGQNTPATTTMATIEQGMKVFTAIYKRIYRSLSSEFEKLFELSKVYFDPADEQKILDIPVQQNDYDNESYDICPAADPQATSNTEKVTKFQAVMQLMSLGTLDPMQVTTRGLKALEITNPQELMRQGPPPPDPKQQEVQMKMQAEQQKSQLKMQESQAKLEHDGQKAQMEQASQAAQMQMQQQMQALDLQFKLAMAKLDLLIKQSDAQASAVSNKQDLVHKEESHQMGMQQQHEAHKQKLKEKPPE